MVRDSILSMKYEELNRFAAVKAVPVVLFAILIAISARVGFMTPLSPVPVTLQTAAVLLAGMLLGSYAGAFSALTYIAIGLMGAPVFSNGVGGPGILLQPSFGYILAFPFAAFLAGKLAGHPAGTRFSSFISAAVAGAVVILLMGSIWLSGHLIIAGLSPGDALKAGWTSGIAPFLLVDGIKVILVTGICSLVRK